MYILTEMAALVDIRQMYLHVRKSGFQNPGHFCLWNTESYKRLESTIQTPLTLTGIHYLESEINGLGSRIQDCLGFPYMGRKNSPELEVCLSCHTLDKL